MREMIISVFLVTLFSLLGLTIPTKIAEAKIAPISGGYSCAGDAFARDSQGKTRGPDDAWTCCGKQTVAGAKPQYYKIIS